MMRMSPEEIMQYMRQQMNEPMQGQKDPNSNEKDW